MKKTLKGQKVLITRATKQAKSLREGIQRLGGETIELPMIDFAPMEDQTQLNQAFEQLENYHWIVFTSANAVDFFFDAAHDYGVKFYFYPELKIATVGEKTKIALEQQGYRTNFVPIQYTAEVLAENMDTEIAGKRILIPRSEIANNEYLDVFLKRGAIPHAIPVYKNIAVEYSAAELREALIQNFDFITFTSGSTVKNFDRNLSVANIQFPSAKVVCIGPSTEKATKQLGIKVDAVAEPYTVDGMIEQIEKLTNDVYTQKT